MDEVKPTKIQFLDFIRIRNSGVTNMFDIEKVCSLSCFGLTEDLCWYIMENFQELKKEYGVRC